MGALHDVLSRVVTRIKGEPFSLDENIPIGYLFSFFAWKAWCLIVGMWKLRRIRNCFVHPLSKIKCFSKIRMGKNLNIDRDCYIDALSINGIQLGDDYA